MVIMMSEPITTEKNVPFYKKIIGLGIMIAVVLYCFPQMREKINQYLQKIRYECEEWREIK